MSLYHFHRVLIASAILFCLGFSVYAYRQYTQTSQPTSLAMALASVAVGVAMVAYLAYFNAAIRKLLHGDPNRA